MPLTIYGHRGDADNRRRQFLPFRLAATLVLLATGWTLGCGLTANIEVLLTTLDDRAEGAVDTSERVSDFTFGAVACSTRVRGGSSFGPRSQSG